MPTKTKAELSEENTVLKGKLKQAINELKKYSGLENSTGKLHDKGIGVFLDEDGTIMLADIDFNAKTKEAKVSNVNPASHLPKDVAMGMYNLKIKFTELFHKATS
jgi:hypothetical protein